MVHGKRSDHLSSVGRRYCASPRMPWGRLGAQPCGPRAFEMRAAACSDHVAAAVAGARRERRARVGLEAHHVATVPSLEGNIEFACVR